MRILPISVKNSCFVNKQQGSKSISSEYVEKDFSKEFSNAVKLQALSNISFTAGKVVPIYKIDKNLNCTLYQSQSDLAREFKLPVQRVYFCLNGRASNISDYVVAYPDQIEKKLEDGTTAIDKKKVAELYTKKTQPHAVYLVDFFGNCSKYSRKEDIETVKNQVVIRASEIEEFDDDGILHINKKQMLLNLLQNPRYSAFYTLDKNGKYNKYDSQLAVSKALNVSTSCVSGVVSGDGITANGHYIIPAIEIETVLEDGTFGIDEKKVSKYIDNLYRNMQCCYLVSRDFNNLTYKKYPTRRELFEKNNIENFSLIKGKRIVTLDNNFVVPAHEIEEYSEENGLVVNEEKLVQIIRECIFEEQKEKSDDVIYTIDLNGELEKYDEISQVSKAISRNECSVYAALAPSNGNKTLAGKVLVRGSEIEVISDEGEVSIDRKKVSQLVIDKFGQRAVYFIDRNGAGKKYKNRHVLENTIGTSYKYFKSQGYFIIPAFEIEEIDENGEIVLNQEKIMKYTKKK